MRDLAKTRVRYGYFRIYILLRREGWMEGGSGRPKMNHDISANRWCIAAAAAQLG